MNTEAGFTHNLMNTEDEIIAERATTTTTAAVTAPRSRVSIAQDTAPMLSGQVSFHNMVDFLIKI